MTNPVDAPVNALPVEGKARPDKLAVTLFVAALVAAVMGVGGLVVRLVLGYGFVGEWLVIALMGAAWAWSNHFWNFQTHEAKDATAGA